MKKKLFFVAAAVAFLHVVNAQTLFTYGKKSINKKEFLKAFDKNPSPDTVDRKKALKEYLDLFINYKLKVQSAYDDKLNEQPIFKNESSTFKNQLADNYINNEANIDFLIQQAFDRSQKENCLHPGHPVTLRPADGHGVLHVHGHAVRNEHG